MKKDFIAARGVAPGLQSIGQVNLDNVQCYAINGQDADYMIDMVKKAVSTHTLLVFLFHGVGGGHNLNVGLSDHSKLLHYLKQNQKDIWVTTMLDAATCINSYQARSSAAQ